MYYLLHHFNPDFNYKHLSPVEMKDKVEYRYLAYVQNVVAGQVLAELLPFDSYPEQQRDPRFIYQHSHLPCGPNCEIHPKKPNTIIAADNGYVFYHDGLITVKKLLNVRGNLGFHTGNIFFLGDLSVHGDIQTGFAAKAKNILVKGHIESAKVKASGDIVCLAGVKGSVSFEETVATEEEKERQEQALPNGLLDAGGSVRLPFCEHMQIRTKGNLIIDGSCVHSLIYAGGTVIIKGRLLGGRIYANKTVYVEGQLGSDYGVKTKILMGYDPFDFLELQKIDSKISYLTEKLSYYEKLIQRSPIMALENTPRYELVQKKLHICKDKKRLLEEKLVATEESAALCKVIVKGNIMAGCSISIGQSSIQTSSMDSDKVFELDGTEVKMKPNSAVSN